MFSVSNALYLTNSGSAQEPGGGIDITKLSMSSVNAPCLLPPAMLGAELEFPRGGRLFHFLLDSLFSGFIKLDVYVHQILLSRQPLRGALLPPFPPFPWGRDPEGRFLC